MILCVLTAIVPVAGADHADDAMTGMDRTIERLDARITDLAERHASEPDAEKRAEMDAERAVLVDDAARHRQARAFLAGLDARVVHAADVDVERALTRLLDDARDADEDVARLEERRARFEERRDALDADATDRRERLDARIADVDAAIAARAADRDRALARFTAFTALDARDDPARLVFAEAALDALRDLDRDVDRERSRVDRLMDRRADLEARLSALDDARGDTLRRLSLDTRLERADADLAAHRAELRVLERARDALATLDADAADDALLERAGVRVGDAFRDAPPRVDLDASDESTRAAASASASASAARESELELDDVLNALALA